jgi:putative transposase
MGMLEQTDISERRACLLVELSRTVLHYAPKVQPENEQLQSRMVELASERRRFGYRRIHALLRRLLTWWLNMAFQDSMLFAY